MLLRVYNVTIYWAPFATLQLLSNISKLWPFCFLYYIPKSRLWFTAFTLFSLLVESVELKKINNNENHSTLKLRVHTKINEMCHINHLNKKSDGLRTRGTSSVWEKCDNLDKHSWLTVWTKKIPKMVSCFDANKVITIFNIIIIIII